VAHEVDPLAVGDDGRVLAVVKRPEQPAVTAPFARNSQTMSPVAASNA
jgi:hypothetical protein